MEDRKRPAVAHGDDIAPPSKRVAVNGAKAKDDNAEMKEENWIDVSVARHPLSHRNHFRLARITPTIALMGVFIDITRETRSTLGGFDQRAMMKGTPHWAWLKTLPVDEPPSMHCG